MQWKSDRPLDVLVYNREFVERNFSSDAEIKGIFTLGEEDVEARRKLQEAKEQRDDVQRKGDRARTQLAEAQGTAAKLREHFMEQCWSAKARLGDEFRDAFAGLHASKERFGARLLAESRNNATEPVDVQELKRKASVLLGDQPQPLELLRSLDVAPLLQLESAPVLARPLVGSADVGIAPLIEHLNNSDWVSTGRAYFDKSDGVCPFCQRPTSRPFAEELAAYFDESFLDGSREVETLRLEYERETDALLAALESAAGRRELFDDEELPAAVARLRGEIEANRRLLDDKVREPSRSLTLYPLQSCVSEIDRILDVGRERIREHNGMLERREAERETLVAQVWRHLLDHEIKSSLTDYERDYTRKSKEIAGLGESMRAHEVMVAELDRAISDLSTRTTSTRPTVDQINQLLSSVGFDAFKIALVDGGPSYELIRPDGSPAGGTLSEGERTFVTFLYFYFLLRGSRSQDVSAGDRVVVIDDPVSSLDSDVLYIVAGLVRGIIKDARASQPSVRQLILLTHNMYFHREVTFEPGAHARTARADETFWTILRGPDGSRLVRHMVDPITSSYALLWREVQQGDGSSVALQNVMRRILENYFQNLGGMKLDDILERFDGDEKLICRSLLSWAHAGSHGIGDDLHLTGCDWGSGAYRRVFRSVFEKWDHLPHYDMMMKATSPNSPCGDASA